MSNMKRQINETAFGKIRASKNAQIGLAAENDKITVRNGTICPKIGSTASGLQKAKSQVTVY